MTTLGRANYHYPMNLPDTDLEISRVFLGTASICGLTAPELDRLIGTYRDAGGRVLDTAHVYSAWLPGGDGCSERAIAAAIKRLGARELVVATKGGHPTMSGYRRCRDWLASHRLRADIEDSLGRLDREAIDLYYLHRDDTSLPAGEIVETMVDFVREGLVRFYGVSNWKASRIEEALEYARANGLPAPVIAQSKFSLADEPSEEERPRGDQMLVVQRVDREFHARTQLPLAAYSAAAGGFFETPTRPRAEIDTTANRARRERVHEVARERGVSATQIAIARLVAQPFPCHPITGTTDAEHLRLNCAGAQIALTEEECRRLDA